ncbi:MAG: hypothetical protein MI919_14480 [Holophagales bacterium]|nr:hypothetical protein [Holophagales bacterium]
MEDPRPQLLPALDRGGTDDPFAQPSGPRWQSARARASRRRWVLLGRLLSFAVLLLALRWIFLRLGADGAALLSYRPPKSFLIALLGAIPLLAALELLPAFAWHRLLVVLGGSGRAQLRRNLLVHARLQVARYLPGHAFQVARHASMRQPGEGSPVPHTALGAGAICEAVGMIAGAAALVCLGFGAALGDGALHLGRAVPPAVLRWAPWLALAGVVSIPLLVARLAGSRLLPGVVAHRPRDSFRAFGLYAAYFAAQGLVFGLILSLIHGTAIHGTATHIAASGGSAWSWPLLAGAGALPLAWLVGFLTPATPAGAGATEAVLVAVLGARYGAVEVLAAALGFRVASIAAHGLLALAAAWLGHRSARRGQCSPNHLATPASPEEGREAKPSTALT